MVGASWQTVGVLAQLAEKGKGWEVALIVQVSPVSAAWCTVTHVALTTTCEVGGSVPTLPLP